MSETIMSHTTKGVPIGVVHIKPEHAQTFRNTLSKVLRTKIRFRGVERVIDRQNEKASLLTIHLPLIAASALAEENPELTKYLSLVGGNFEAGVRRRPIEYSWIVESPPPLLFRKRKKEDTNSDTFSFVELFAGIGGFRLGLEALRGTCKLSLEINPTAANIYRRNFDSSSFLEGDILDMETSHLNNLDMFTAGFPCHSYTHKAGRDGLIDERIQLYQELVRFLYDCRPKCFIFENIIRLVTMDGGSCLKHDKGEQLSFKPGKPFERMINSFKECGYRVEWKVINSRYFLPQQRERVYIVGIRDDIGACTFDWESLVNRASENASSTVREIMEPKESPSVIACELNDSQWAKVKGLHQKKQTIPSRDACIHPDGKAPSLTSQYHRPSSYSTKYFFEQSDGTVCDGSNGNQRPRFLTPRECCRIMGFPDDFVVPSATDSLEELAHFYQAIGNAVTPPVITAIAKEVLRCVHNNKRVKN
mmetsp:Transcript_58467/g.70382  ORF Transcript_58467/g.70382 Transcript_58467/m.70382 type:complete len:477 (-) Transcript_58467:417-1847(-)